MRATQPAAHAHRTARARLCSPELVRRDARVSPSPHAARGARGPHSRLVAAGDSDPDVSRETSDSSCVGDCVACAPHGGASTFWGVQIGRGAVRNAQSRSRRHAPEPGHWEAGGGRTTCPASEPAPAWSHGAHDDPSGGVASGLTPATHARGGASCVSRETHGPVTRRANVAARAALQHRRPANPSRDARNRRRTDEQQSDPTLRHLVARHRARAHSGQFRSMTRWPRRSPRST